MQATAARDLFNRNAATYDWVNSIISFGLDTAWKNWLAKQVTQMPGAYVLDACSGTGEVGLRAAVMGAHVVLADISPAMLSIAKDRAQRLGVTVDTQIADLTDAQSVFSPASFDAIILSFALRYIENKHKFISSLAALLNPGGRLIILEFVNPPKRPVPMAAALYFYHVLPVIGSFLARDRELYDYLVSSVAQIGRAVELERLVADAGLLILNKKTFGFGLVHAVVAGKEHVGVSPSL